MIEEAVTNSETIPEMFLQRVYSTPDAVAYEHKVNGQWQSVTYNDYGELVEKAALGFRKLGLEKGECVAILGDTEPEWTILDLGAMAAGGHVAGIYQTSTPEQGVYILNDSSSKFLCVDKPERLNNYLELRDQFPGVRKIVLWSGEKPEGVEGLITYEELLALGEEGAKETANAYEEMVAEVTADMYATLVYTSGTTGLPKGVILTHRNCMTNCKKLFEIGLIESTDSMIAFLPMSHVAEHTSQFLGRLLGGMRAYFCPDMTKVGEVVKEKQPTILIAVPRVYEKVYQRITAAVSEAPPRKQQMFHWAISQGHQVAKLKEEGKSIPAALLIKHKLADKLVLSKVRQQLGGKMRLMGCAAAPIDVEVIDFFMAIGIIFLEAYGLSECGGASHCNRPDAYRVGTVGRPVDGTECVLAEDGEVLIRSEAVFKGYLNKPEETAEMLDDEGWLHTGDIGEIDAEGFLKITDRKKNLIITAGGKNVAPAGIELLLKRESIISQAVVLGDRKPYLIALLTLNPDNIANLSEDQVRERVEKVIDEANTKLARYEQVKKYRILDREFSVESGEMTPTMKIKRNVVSKNWNDLVEEIYSESGAEQEAAHA